MYTQAATAMTTMLATTTTATNPPPLPLITLTVGVYMVGMGLWMWIIGIASSDTPAPRDNSHRTQKIISVAAMVIGLLIAIAGITAL